MGGHAWESCEVAVGSEKAYAAAEAGAAVVAAAAVVSVAVAAVDVLDDASAVVAGAAIHCA